MTWTVINPSHIAPFGSLLDDGDKNLALSIITDNTLQSSLLKPNLVIKTK